ncbi:lamin tail domain-containing protein [Arthrobacter gandavensis]|uniref:metallophosphoesterase n=1 Tax=Arthrobacter gandavensis TaxID=169960 RepID=UPI00188E847B|nr:lamin tail domain-containing protein [Arthrobacter gandavensis]MBF4995381.1 lamin tail domain-containing protein [Arthrobacter gandavensis]
MVTEIAPDNTGYDNFEFFEVLNTTGTDISVGTAGAQLSYTYADSDDRSRDVLLEVPDGTVIKAGQAAVFWVQYQTATVDTASKTDAEFRAYYASLTGSASTEYPLVRVSGQAGLANGGERGIRVSDTAGRSISWSYYPAGSTGIDVSAHFGSGDSGGGALQLFSSGAPTPGIVDPAALEPTGPAPEPTPTEPQPTPTPTEPEPDPSPTGTPADPKTAAGAELQITELLADSPNVGGSDGFEFVEVYNPTSQAINFSDYQLRYLYPLEDLSNSSVTDWPATPGDVAIPAGGTLVFWIKNGPNDGLGADEFNRIYGTSLAAGTNIVEIHTGGMANGSARGIEITTKSGIPVNRAYYNLGGTKDVAAGQGLQYTADPEDRTRQALLGNAAPTPGSVSGQQAANPLQVLPIDGAAPEITDATASTFNAGTELSIEAEAKDDSIVRSLTLYLKSSADQDFTAINLQATNTGIPSSLQFTHKVATADLTGKKWYEYYLAASDGTTTSRTELRRINAEGVDNAPVRLNLEDGQFVSGTTTVAAAADQFPSPVQLGIDGTVVESTVPALEDEPVFAFEAGGVDTFFRNGVLAGEDVLHIFDDGIYEGYETITVPVPLSKVSPGRDTVLSVYSGTKAAPEIDPDENNDDFQIKNLRMILPDGRTLYPAGYTDPNQVLNMGDSAGKLDFFDASFTVPENAFTARSYAWDTTAVPDGGHTVSAEIPGSSLTRTVSVDNTAPALATTIEDGRDYQGVFTIDASASDAGSGVDSISAVLDGETIQLPYETSSLTLQAGSHDLAITGEDKAGNIAERTIRFTTPVEQPSADGLSPADNTAIDGGPVTLSARVTDPSADRLDVCFREGYRLTPGTSSMASYSGTTSTAAGLDRSAKTLLDQGELQKILGSDGIESAVSSSSEFPYQLFEVTVPPGAGTDYTARLKWTGSANPEAKVLMYVLNRTTGAWEEVDRHVTTSGAAGAAAFDLTAMVPAADHTADGKMQVLIQHSEGFAGADRSTRSTAVAPAHPQDTPRNDYDFTLGWESDTQYYNETFYDHQLNIHKYFLDRRDDLNLQYVFHTGDIVDESDKQYQWENADAAYRQLDEAGLPYGVLAGNHDVGHKTGDYGAFSNWFGAKRFSQNPWYGGTYQDNRGHYDLITAGGIDFIMLYMGWGPADEEIDWMNSILEKYPERTAVLNLHEYLLTTGGLGPVPQRIQNEVVAANPNVYMVFSGHYHDAYTRVDEFDDDGDGTADRKVQQILFDYQGLPEGGQGFLRLLHFDNAAGNVTARTYSPSLDQYNSTDPSLEPQHQEFTMSYADLGIEIRAKELATDAFSVDVLTTADISCQTEVESGSVVTAAWATPGEGGRGWYVETRDPHGAVHYSPVNLLALNPGPVPDPTDPADPPVPGDGNGTGDGNGGGQTPGTGTGGTGTGGTGTGGTGQAPGTSGPGTAGAGTDSGSGDSGPAGSNPSAADPDAANGKGTLAATGVQRGWMLAAGAGALLIAAGVVLRFAKRGRAAQH